MAAAEDDEYEIPLRDQRVFGAGIKRKRIAFVPSTTELTSTQSLPATPRASASQRYLDIVLKKPASAEPASALSPNDGEATATNADSDGAPPEATTCEICHRPLSPTDSDAVVKPHETSMAHQICLQHSHPPSHVDRTLKSLAVLQNQGWDPDSRLGLGAEGRGRLHPVRAVENPKRAGLGAKFDPVKVVEKPVKLDAGKVKALEKERKKKAEGLRNAFYRSEEVEKYLGEDQSHRELDLKAFEQAKRGF